MTGINNKYKERDPKDTIKILKQFFIEKGYTLKKVIDNHSEADTYSCRWEIYMYDTCIMGANGKGMTNEFSEASGLAELYERFCAKSPFLNNLMAIDKYTEINYTNNNYLFEKDEIIGNPNEVLKIDSIRDFFVNAFGGNEDCLNLYLDLILKGKSINVPYINLEDTKNKIYTDPRALSRVYTSNGLAAGNTLDEAINQGMSELYERIGEQKFLYFQQDKYYAINLDSLKDKYMYNTYKKIQDLGYDVYVLDLSYNFNIPTLMSIIVNKNLGNIHINFGSFPVFDIALERIITEIYQGINFFKREDFIQLPFNSISNYKNYILKNAVNSTSYINSIFEDIFEKIIYVDKCSSIFLENNNVSNLEIKNKCIEYNKNLNYKVYYKDISLMNNFYAVQLFISNIIDVNVYYDKKYCYMHHDNAFYNLHTQFILRQKLIYDTIISENFEMYCAIVEYALKIIDLSDYDGGYVGNLIFADWGYLWETPTDYIFDLKGILKNSRPFVDAFSYKDIRKYTTLYNYKNSNYNFSQVKKIFEKLGFDITQEDWDNINSWKYVAYKSYYEPLVNFYKSNDYKKLLKTFIK